MDFAKGLIGLDLSDLVLRAVALSPTRPVPTLTAYQELLLPHGLIEEGEIRRADEVSRRIRTLLRESQPAPIKRKLVVASLPDRRSFVKLLDLPNVPDGKLERAILAQLPQHIPFGLDEIYLDWQRVQGPGAPRGAILVGASPRTLVDQYLKTLEQAGVTVVALEMESLALARALFVDLPPTQSTLIVDIGGSRTTVVGVTPPSVLFSSSLPFSGTNFTQRLAQSLKVSFEDAEQQKFSTNVASPRRSNAVRALRDAVEQLSFHVSEVLHFAESHFPTAAPIQSILLCGGGAQLTGIDATLAQLLSRTVTVRRPPVRLGRHVKLLPSRLPSYTTAIGLALHHV